MHALIKKILLANFFEKKLKEVFQRAAQPVVATLIFLPLSALFVATVQHTRPLAWPSALGFYVFGMFVMTFIEYCFHRFPFHQLNAQGDARHDYAKAHLAHHRDPQAAFSSTATPIFGVLVIPPHFLLWWIVLHEWTWALTLIAGCFPAYVAYEWTHYAIHHWDARYRWQQRLWAHHFRHHDADPRKNFGVTSSLWDWVLRTKYSNAPTS